jgi:DNA-binding transcriptional ArsR family regulator
VKQFFHIYKVTASRACCKLYDPVVPRAPDLRLDAPGALRALAHPARLAVVEELYQGLERTASELAELTGLSPSAMSYHLRALERWGVVERAAARGDGRERPWRAVGRSLTLETASSEDAAAKEVIFGATLQSLRDELRRWSLAEANESEVWRDVAGVGRSFLWLTETEAGAFAAEMKALLERYIADRDVVNHPADARRVACVVAVAPIVPEPAGL